MSQMKWRAAAPLLTAALLLAVTAEANVIKEMGKIVSTDWRKMEIEIKNPRGRMKVWKVARDCKVTFTDKKDEFPDPKLSDLREPMYIWFSFQDGTIEIESIEVREVGFEPSKAAGVQEKAVITNLDANIGHVEVDLGLGVGPQTSKVEPKQQLTAFQRGQRVILVIEKRKGQEIVTKITPQR